MRKRYIIYITLIVVSIFASSCEDNIVDQFTPIEEKWESLDDFIASTDSEKTVTIAESSEAFVIETENALIQFPAGTIKNTLTNEVAEGEVKIRYTEIDTYKDLFFNQLHSVGTDNEVLYAQYVIKIDFVQGSNNLNIDANNPPAIYLEKADNTVDNERVFYWEEDMNNSGWFINANIDVFEEEWDFSVNGKQYTGKGYKMLVRDVGYFTISEHEHILYQMQSDYSQVNIEVDQSFKNSNTKVFIARQDYFSLIPMDLINGNYVHTLIRKGEPVTAFAVTVKDEKLYFGKKSFIVGDENTYNLNFNETSYIEVIEELRGI